MPKNKENIHALYLVRNFGTKKNTPFHVASENLLTMFRSMYNQTMTELMSQKQH